MKRLFGFILLFIFIICAVWASDTVLAKAWLDFDAYKKTTNTDVIFTGWEYSIRVIDYIQSGSGNALSPAGEQINVDKEQLSNEGSHFFDVVYTTNSVKTPVKITVDVSNFVPVDDGTPITTQKSYTATWQFVNEYEPSDIDTTDRYDSLIKLDTVRTSIEDKTGASGFIDGEEVTGDSNKRIFRVDSNSSEDVIWWHNNFYTKEDNYIFWKEYTYYYRKHFADLEYKISANISVEEDNFPDSGTYVMQVKIMLETDA